MGSARPDQRQSHSSRNGIPSDVLAGSPRPPPFCVHLGVQNFPFKVKRSERHSSSRVQLEINFALYAKRWTIARLDLLSGSASVLSHLHSKVHWIALMIIYGDSGIWRTKFYTNLRRRWTRMEESKLVVEPRNGDSLDVGNKNVGAEKKKGKRKEREEKKGEEKFINDLNRRIRSNGQRIHRPAIRSVDFFSSLHFLKAGFNPWTFTV